MSSASITADADATFKDSALPILGIVILLFVYFKISSDGPCASLEKVIIFYQKGKICLDSLF